MSLVFYHKSHPDRYEFTHVRLNNVFDFIEGYFAYLHMNFKARNVATGSEQIFFSELMAEMDNNDNASNGYYRVSACDIVDDNCAGGRKQEVECKYIPYKIAMYVLRKSSTLSEVHTKEAILFRTMVWKKILPN
uniref:DUF3615 domain-containing protein n=1 Tax=Triticum urartu TaxID=4572 RepID=A0A8R7UJF3_TRIUA